MGSSRVRLGHRLDGGASPEPVELAGLGRALTDVDGVMDVPVPRAAELAQWARGDERAGEALSRGGAAGFQAEVHDPVNEALGEAWADEVERGEGRRPFEDAVEGERLPGS